MYLYKHTNNYVNPLPATPAMPPGQLPAPPPPLRHGQAPPIPL